MGQRSQIYVRIKKNNEVYLIASYYQWNYGERMISRARHTLDWISSRLEFSYFLDSELKTLKKVIDVNFDMQDVLNSIDIIKEWQTEDWAHASAFNNYIFNQDNNDGKLFIDITVKEGKEHSVKYCLTSTDQKILSPARYMQWDYKGWQKSEYLKDEVKKTCADNIKALKKYQMMTAEELEEFINFNYEQEAHFIE